MDILTVALGTLVLAVLIAFCCWAFSAFNQRRASSALNQRIVSGALNQRGTFSVFNQEGAIQSFIREMVFFDGTEQAEFESVDGSNPAFDKFIIEEVIPRTKEQRKVLQFACLMLLPHPVAEKPVRFHYLPNIDGRPYTNVDNNPFSPQVKQFNNYIIARPTRRHKHAEIVILDHLNELLNAYKSTRRNQNPIGMILYSWIIPCKKCTSELVDKLPQLGVPVTIAYTIPYHMETEQDKARSMRRIEQSGMTIEQVDYSK